MRGLLALAAIWVSLGLGAAHAQPTATADADATVAAQAHLDRGVAAFAAHAYAEAHHEFTEANRLAPDRANPYRWLALTEVQLDDCPAALGHIAGFVARVAADDPRLAEMFRLRALCHRVDRPGPVAPAASTARPVTTRWWFWTAIGGAVAIAAVTTFAATRGDDLGELPTIHCTMAGCAR